MDGTSLNRPLGHLALDYRSERVRATLDLNGVGDTTRGGPPGFTIVPGVGVPTAPRLDRMLGQRWTDYRQAGGFGVIRVEYDIAPDWTADFASSNVWGHENGRYDGDVQILNAGGDFRWTADIGDGSTYRFSNQAAYLRGAFRTGPLSRRVVAFGTNGYERYDFRRFHTFATLSNLYNPIYVAGLGSHKAPPGDRLERYRQGPLLADEIGLFDDRLVFTLGGRWTLCHRNGGTGLPVCRPRKSTTPAGARSSECWPAPRPGFRCSATRWRPWSTARLRPRQQSTATQPRHSSSLARWRWGLRWIWAASVRPSPCSTWRARPPFLIHGRSSLAITAADASWR